MKEINPRRAELIAQAFDARDVELRRFPPREDLLRYCTEALEWECSPIPMLECNGPDWVPLDQMLHGMQLKYGQPALVRILRALIRQPRFVETSVRGLSQAPRQ